MLVFELVLLFQVFSSLPKVDLESFWCKPKCMGMIVLLDASLGSLDIFEVNVSFLAKRLVTFFEDMVN